MAIINFEKKYTETLNEMLERFRFEHPKYRNAKLSYAGRLDPLAQGAMIILSDDDVHLKEQYLKKSKTYVVDLIIGVETDTYDIMGIPTTSSADLPTRDAVEGALAHIALLKKLPYPVYSSRTVLGIPLFKYAREQKLETISIPDFEVVIHSYQLDNVGEITKLGEYINIFTESIASVTGDFRQDMIINSWRNMNSDSPVRTIRITFSVGSGVYIRSLVHELGKMLGTGACCVRIERISID